MTCFNFFKKKGVFMISPENLNCSYYHELKLLQKDPIFNEAIWTFELPPLSRGIILSDIRQFWWCLTPLPLWPSPIPLCPYYHNIAPIMKFSRKIKPSLERFTWKFDLPLESQAEVLIMSPEKLNYSYYQPQCCGFQRRIWTCQI